MREQTNLLTIIFIGIFVVLVIVGAAHFTPEQLQLSNCLGDYSYGFFGGLWHEFIIPLSFVMSLFLENTIIYAINNTGGWYDFGFLLGAGIISFSISLK